MSPQDKNTVICIRRNPSLFSGHFNLMKKGYSRSQAYAVAIPLFFQGISTLPFEVLENQPFQVENCLQLDPLSQKFKIINEIELLCIAQGFGEFHPYSKAKEPTGKSYPLGFFQKIEEIDKDFNMISIRETRFRSAVKDLYSQRSAYSESLERVSAQEAEPS